MLDTVAPMPYAGVNRMLDGGLPRGARNYWKSAFLAELSPEAIEVMVDALARTPSDMSCIIVEHLHGAVTRVELTATAFPRRAEGYSVLVLAQWADPAADDANLAWARETLAALDAHTAERRYMNYLSHDEATHASRAAYGANYERVCEVKRRYDPGNVFHLNQNIDRPDPACEGVGVGPVA